MGTNMSKDEPKSRKPFLIEECRTEAQRTQLEEANELLRSAGSHHLAPKDFKRRERHRAAILRDNAVILIQNPAYLIESDLCQAEDNEIFEAVITFLLDEVFADDSVVREILILLSLGDVKFHDNIRLAFLTDLTLQDITAAKARMRYHLQKRGLNSLQAIIQLIEDERDAG